MFRISARASQNRQNQLIGALAVTGAVIAMTVHLSPTSPVLAQGVTKAKPATAAPPKATAAKPAAGKPASAPAQGEPDPKDAAEIAAINKLISQATSALQGAQIDAAHTALQDASRQLAAFVKRTKSPEWSRNVAPLFQRISRANTTLAQKSKTAGKTLESAVPAAIRIPPADLKEVAEARKNLLKVKSMIVRGDVEGAQKAIEEAEAVFNKAVKDSGAPMWHEALAPAFQALDLQKIALAEEEQAQKEEAVVAAQDAADANSKALKVGDKAPAFTALKVDGKPLNSKTLAGKWVLIDFWATWCGPCREEIPRIREVYEAHAKDDRLVVLSLSIDDQIAKPREFARINDMKWVQGFLGNKSPLLDQYGIRGIPAIYLIDPSGRIAAVGLRGERIKKVVAEALADKPST